MINWKLAGVKIAICIAIGCMLTACNDSFVGIIGGGYEHEPDPTSPEVVRDRIPVVVSFIDPLYDFYNPSATRAEGGMGAFDGWNADQQKWQRAQFHLFAMRSANFANGHTANFADASQSLPGIYNNTAHVAEQGILRFDNTDETLFYDAVNPDYRYKFFAFFADSIGTEAGKREVIDELQYGRSTISARVPRIDGSQDIMVGFAYHTESEIDARLRTLQRNGYGASNFTKMIANYRDAVLYSNTSARGGLHPILHLRHVMTRFDVKVRGCRSTASPKMQTYRNIVITDIALEAPTAGTLTVANDAWRDEETFDAAYNARQIFAPDLESRDFIGIPTNEQRLSDAQRRDYDFCLTGIRNHYDNSETLVWPWAEGDEQHWWHVNSERYEDISEGHFVVPNSDSYRLRVRYYFVRREWDHANNKMTDYYEDPDAPLTVDTDGSPLITAIFPVTPPAPSHFEQGKRYSIALDIYGPQLINVSVKALDKWENGGTVNIDIED